MLRNLFFVLTALTALSPIASTARGPSSGVVLVGDTVHPWSPGVTQIPGGGFRIPYSTLMANDTIPPGSVSTTDPVIVDGQTSTGGNWGASGPDLIVFFGPSFPCNPSGTCSYSVNDPQGVPIPGATALIDFQAFPPIAQATADEQTFASDAPAFIIDVFANDAGFPADATLFTPQLVSWPGLLGTPYIATLPNGRKAIGWTHYTPPTPCGDIVVEYFWVGCLGIPSPTVTATFHIVLAGGDCNGNCVEDALEPDADLDGIPNDCEFTLGDANAPVVDLVNAPDSASTLGTATDNRPSEDVDGDHYLDPGEDLNGNFQLDTDTGISSVVLLTPSTNLALVVPPFVPGAPSVQFRVNLIDSSLPGYGVVRIDDGAGNFSQRTVILNGVQNYLFLGFGPGTSTHSVFGHDYPALMSSVRVTRPVTTQQIPSFLAPSSLSYVVRPVRVQVHLWNPNLFPFNPQQWSQVVTVRGSPGGTNTVTYSGTSNGIAIQCEFFTDQNGVLRMRFPFQVAGM